jgi:SAM-dependent methyltransferase
MRATLRGALLATAAWAVLAGAACAQAAPAQTGDTAYPRPERPVARVVSPAWANESDRDRTGEADRVMEILRIGPGVRVADLGAGAGYYTVRIARRLGGMGTVYAEDVDPAYLADLETRLNALGLTSVQTVVGRPGDPMLPPASVDVAILGHMYHEIRDPYGFLARLVPAMAPGGKVGVVDLDRPTLSHGTPLPLLRCEMAATGYRLDDVYQLIPSDGYLAVFTPPDRAPAAAEVHPCAGSDR